MVLHQLKGTDTNTDTTDTDMQNRIILITIELCEL